MLKALAEYYDCLCSQKDSELVPDGYSKINANYNVVITSDGELKEILDFCIEGVQNKKMQKIPREVIFPFRNSVSGISSETIEHRGKYLFGIDWDKDNMQFIVNKNSLLAFEKCKEKNMEFLSDLSSPIINAYMKFLMKWNPLEEIENVALVVLGKLYDTAKFVISLEDEIGVILNEQPLIKEKWESANSCQNTQSDVVAQCSISGKVLPIARIHDNLSGVMGGLGTGVNLVCFKNSAFWSYGKKESYNSSVSEEIMKKYTKSFNYLTSTKNHKQLLDDMTLLFWAQTKDDEQPYIDCFNWNCFSNQNNMEERTVIENEISSIFQQLSKGEQANWKNIGVNENTDFYILGIKPNSSRLAIKLFEKNSFENIMKNVAKHHIDMQLTSEDKQLSIWMIKNELKSPVSMKENINPELSTKILKSILTGCPYPRYMLETVVRRAKTDQDDKNNKFNSINQTRVRIIKACLTRQNMNEEGELNMLNEANIDSSYNCGRLFAMLEKIQCDALGDINTTIKDKFFSSACSTPYLVFPRLLKLSQTHLSKLEKPSLIFWENRLQEVLGKLNDNFPKAQSIEKQGIFILGYYQQKQKFYEKKENKENRGENVCN